MLFWNPFSIKLLKFEGLAAGRHFKVINCYCIGLGIPHERLGDNIGLVLDDPFNEIFQIINQDYSLKKDLYLLYKWCFFYRMFGLVNFWSFPKFMARIFVYSFIRHIHKLISLSIFILHIFGRPSIAFARFAG